MTIRTPLLAILLLLVALTGAASEAPAGGGPILLQDLAGGEVTLDETLSGGPKLVFFWTTWCGYCRAEIPRLKEAHLRFRERGLEVVAIDPGIRDTVERARAYVSRYELPYRVLFDPTRATVDRFELVGTPTVLLLDAEGNVVHRGHEVDLEAVEALLGSEG